MESTNLLTRMGIPLPWEDGLPTIPEIKPSPNYAVGELIMGRYRVMELFKGSMGDVYHCFDQRRDDEVALKTVISSGKMDHSRMSSFYAELDRLLKLPYHPNILEFRRIEAVDGYYYLVTDWVSSKNGSTLRDLKGKKTFSSAEVLNFMQQILCGLLHCRKYLPPSDRHFVLGDIKPENIFVTILGVYQLGDFSGGYTEGWSLPELGNAEPDDERNYIFGLGKTASFLSSPLVDYGSELSDCLDEVLQRCADYSGEDAFPTLEELQKELNALCTRFGLEGYKEKKYFRIPAKEEYDRLLSALNLHQSPLSAEPDASYEELAYPYKGQLIGALAGRGSSVHEYMSIHDFLESASAEERALFEGKLHFFSGRMDRGFTALQIPEMTPELLYWKGAILFAMGKPEDSVHCLLSAALLEDHLQALDLLASVFLDYREIYCRFWQEAASIQKRLDKLPKSRLTGYLPFQVIAKYYLLRENYQMASSYFRRCLQYPNPETDWQTLYYYGSCESARGSSDTARLILETAVSQILSDPEHRQNRYKTCVLLFCYLALDRIREAEELSAWLLAAFGLDYSAQINAWKHTAEAGS